MFDENLNLFHDSFVSLQVIRSFPVILPQKHCFCSITNILSSVLLLLLLTIIVVINFKLHLKVTLFPYYPLGLGTAAGQSSAVRTRLSFFLFLPSVSHLLLHLANNCGFFLSPWSGIEGVREGERGQESSYLTSIHLRLKSQCSLSLAGM